MQQPFQCLESQHEQAHRYHRIFDDLAHRERHPRVCIHRMVLLVSGPSFTLGKSKCAVNLMDMLETDYPSHRNATLRIMCQNFERIKRLGKSAPEDKRWLFKMVKAYILTTLENMPDKVRTHGQNILTAKAREVFLCSPSTKEARKAA
jgi:hypothetical protein